MKIEYLRMTGFKRFSSFAITSIPDTARMVILIGPNGSGKSSVFEAVAYLYKSNGEYEDLGKHFHYYHKDTRPYFDKNNKLKFFGKDFQVECRFHGDASKYNGSSPWPPRTKSFPSIPPTSLYFRAPPLGYGVSDSVSKNTTAESNMALVSKYLPRPLPHNVFQANPNDLSTIFRKIKASVTRVFSDKLELRMTGNIQDTTNERMFFFARDYTKKVFPFAYITLSSGEKMAFDLLVDLHLTRKSHCDTVFFIDEIDASLDSSTQKNIVREVYDLVPQRCQVWVTAHSNGVLQAARSIEQKNPGTIVFIDMTEHDFDIREHIETTPISPDEVLTKRMADIILGDVEMWNLPSGKVKVICEGCASSKHMDDASVYTYLFKNKKDYENMMFVSIGGHKSVEQYVRITRIMAKQEENIEIVFGIIDLDKKTKEDIKKLPPGIFPLGRKNIEYYLLSDKVIDIFCEMNKVSPHDKEEILNRVSDAKNKGRLDHNSSQKIMSKMQKSVSGENLKMSLRSFTEKKILPCLKEDTEGYTELENSTVKKIKNYSKEGG